MIFFVVIKVQSIRTRVRTKDDFYNALCKDVNTVFKYHFFFPCPMKYHWHLAQFQKIIVTLSGFETKNVKAVF